MERWNLSNLEIQCVSNTSAQVEAVVEARGMASGHLVLQSTTVKRYSHPPETGRGPTRDQESASADMEGHKKRRDNMDLVVWPLG